MFLFIVSVFSPSVACGYGVTDISDGGERTMRNRLVVTTTPDSPSGVTVPGYSTVATMRFDAFRPECGKIVVENMQVFVTASDSSGTWWPMSNEITVGGMTIELDGPHGSVQMPYTGYGWDMFSLFDLWYEGLSSEFVVSPALPRVLDFVLDTSGAVLPTGNTIQLVLDTVTWRDSRGKRVTEEFGEYAYVLGYP